MAFSTPKWGRGYQNTQIQKDGPKYPRDTLMTKSCVEIRHWETRVLRYATSRGVSSDTVAVDTHSGEAYHIRYAFSRCVSVVFSRALVGRIAGRFFAIFSILSFSHLIHFPVEFYIPPESSHRPLQPYTIN